MALPCTTKPVAHINAVPVAAALSNAAVVALYNPQAIEAGTTLYFPRTVPGDLARGQLFICVSMTDLSHSWVEITLDAAPFNS